MYTQLSFDANISLVSNLISACYICCKCSIRFKFGMGELWAYNHYCLLDLNMYFTYLWPQIFGDASVNSIIPPKGSLIAMTPSGKGQMFWNLTLIYHTLYSIWKKHFSVMSWPFFCWTQQKYHKNPTTMMISQGLHLRTSCSCRSELKTAKYFPSSTYIDKASLEYGFL